MDITFEDRSFQRMMLRVSPIAILVVTNWAAFAFIYDLLRVFEGLGQGLIKDKALATYRNTFTGVFGILANFGYWLIFLCRRALPKEMEGSPRLMNNRLECYQTKCNLIGNTPTEHQKVCAQWYITGIPSY